MKTVTKKKKRIIALLLSVLTLLTTILGNVNYVHAEADGTINFDAGYYIGYGSYSTTRMTFDGGNTAFCVEPDRPTPANGNYIYNLLDHGSSMRKAMYYLIGGYGYDKVTKAQLFSGWSDDDAYVVGHIVLSYMNDGFSGSGDAFMGATQDYIDKAMEFVNALGSLPNPPDSFNAFIVPGLGAQAIVGSWYKVPNGWLELVKSSANADVSDGNVNYSLKDAEYGIYQGNNLIQKLTTDENGYAKSGELEEGNYTVKELSASQGYIVDPNGHQVTVRAEQTVSANVTEIPQNNRMDLILEKVDAETKTAVAQGAATLEGAEFTVKFYTEQSDTDPAEAGKQPVRTWILKTDASGKINFTNDYFVSGDNFYYTSDGTTVCLPMGTVTVQESKAPEGYQINPTVYVQKIAVDGDQETVSVYQPSTVEESVIRGGVKIQKRDFETGEAKAQGAATLEGAEFTITTLNENPVLVNGTSYTNGQVVLTLTTDKAGVTATQNEALPYGHYRVDEKKAPTGYLNSGKNSMEFNITEQGKIVELTSKENAISNQIIRGDLEFVKVSDGDLARLANVPFSITSVTTGESHTIVTDKNGYASTASSWNKHSNHTNEGKTSEDGIWFGSSAVNDNKGALLYDEYVIEEQKCEANKGMNLLKFNVTIYKDSVKVDLGTLTDDHIDIQTTAKDSDTESHISNPDEKVTIIDTVSYEGLKKGQEYKLTGVLMDKSTGKSLLVDGKEVTAETTFKAKKTSGEVEVAFTFDGSGLKGKTIVVFESLFQKDIELAVHADIEDEDQTIHFPEIGTTAKDTKTEANVSCAEKDVTLIDTVAYKNLVPGKEYKVIGVLMDKETKKEVTVDGKKVTAEAMFTPEKASGNVDVTFTFDGSSLKGKTVVVFETMKYKEKTVSVHADIEDERQTVRFPEIGTTAKDTKTDTNIAKAEKEVTLIDTVAYKNLTIGKEYRVTGVVMDQESGKELLVNDKKVTSEVVFTAEKTEGSVEVTFTFDGSELEGKSVVVFETLYQEDKKLAVHADIEDEGQTVHFPKIGTTATDAATGKSTAVATGKVTIKDVVAYQNLVPGKEYKVSGILMDKSTGKALLINGKEVKSEAVFTPKKSDGTVEVEFTFEAASLVEKDIVVFESVSCDGKEVAVHTDLNDKGQTVSFVKKTEAPKEKTVVSNNVPKTGDTAPIIPVAVFGGIGALAVLVLLIKRKNRK